MAIDCVCALPSKKCQCEVVLLILIEVRMVCPSSWGRTIREIINLSKKDLKRIVQRTQEKNHETCEKKLSALREKKNRANTITLASISLFCLQSFSLVLVYVVSK